MPREVRHTQYRQRLACGGYRAVRRSAAEAREPGLTREPSGVHPRATSYIYSGEGVAMIDEKNKRRYAFGVWFLILALVGCGNGTEPEQEPEQLSLADVVGAWVVEVPANPSCAPPGPASQRFIHLTAGAYSLATRGGVVNFVDDWEIVDPPRFEWPVTGNIDLDTRVLKLRLWLRMLDVGSQLTADLSSDGRTLTGTLSDPIPGYDAHFVLGSCSWEVTGRKR